jgi:hypothetical protein
VARAASFGALIFNCISPLFVFFFPSPKDQPFFGLPGKKVMAKKHNKKNCILYWMQK